jgi:hypothetical protein
MVGGELRLSMRTKLISENWVLPVTDEVLYSLGVRWFGRNMSADFALLRTSEMTGILGIPWVDFIVTF